MRIYSIHEYSAVINSQNNIAVLTYTVSLPVAPCAFLGLFERYWASYEKWKVREGEEIEGWKPSWFTGKTHHTLSAIKSSHALRSVQELASNRPDASSDRQTDQKTIYSPNTGEKATTFQSFSSAIFPSWPAMTPTVWHTTLFSGYKQMSQSTIELWVFLIWICKADQLFPTYFGIGFCFSELFCSVCCNARAYSAVPQI